MIWGGAVTLGHGLVANAKEHQALIHQLRTPPGGKIEISYSVPRDTYCILERTTQILASSFQPIEIQVPDAGVNRFVVSAEPESSAFFRLHVVEVGNPNDTDRDGLNDYSEIENGLNPLHENDAYEDNDRDGFSNLEEIRLGWNLRNDLSPNPVQLSRLPLRGGTIAHRTVGPDLRSTSPTLTSTTASRNPMSPEVSVNKHGTVAFIAEVPDSTGTLRPQIMVGRRLDDGRWQEAGVMTDSQSRVTMKLGPGLQINDAGIILVRRYHIKPGAFGGTPTTSLEKWDGRVLDGISQGNLETVADTDIGFSSNFTLIDENCALNNRGNVVYFASGRSGRFLVVNRNQAAAPLSATTLETPIALSDVDTFAIRVGDKSGSIRLFELNRLNVIWRLNAGESGFYDLGRGPGISADGRILTFYADYRGATNENIGTIGPGIFALVSQSAISFQSINRTKLIRLAGLAGNGGWDPGEEWHDKNRNGSVDVDEDLGKILAFDPDQAIGVSDNGFVAFVARGYDQNATDQGAARLSTVPSPTQAAVENGISVIKLHNLISPWVGEPQWMTLPEERMAHVRLQHPMAGSTPTYLAYSASIEPSSHRIPLLTRLGTAQIGADVNRDGVITLPGVPYSSANKGRLPDMTSDQDGKRFVFWTNSNKDESRDGEDQDFEPGSTDNDFHTPHISCPKDLEDFARVSIVVDASLASELLNGETALGIGWSPNSSQSPILHFWPNLSPSGGRQYLTEHSVSREQLFSPSFHTTPSFSNPPHVTWIPPSSWKSGTASLSTVSIHLIFEAELPLGGMPSANGQLGCYLRNRQGQITWIGGQLSIQVSPISYLYEHWTAGDNSNQSAPIPLESEHPLNAPFEYDSRHPGLSMPGEPDGKSYILFVHGWRMQPWERRAYAESAFKRLYHQGYKGKFGLFSWPTEYIDYSSWKKVVNPFWDPRHYNRSEFAARRSGNGPLHQLLMKLRTLHGAENVHVFAHSMGNIVVSEALRAHPPEPLIAGFIACQSAEVSTAYDSSPSWQRPTGSLLKAIQELYASKCTSDKVPDYYRYEVPDPFVVGSGDSMLKEGPYYKDLRMRLARARGLINFGNFSDTALNVWDYNQASKPSCLDQWPSDPRYILFLKESNGSPNHQIAFYRYSEPVFEVQFDDIVELHWSRLPDRFEILSQIVPARSRAAGAVIGLGGEFDTSKAVDLGGPGFCYGDDDFSHSKEFTGSFAERRRFYHMLLDRFGLDSGEPPSTAADCSP